MTWDTSGVTQGYPGPASQMTPRLAGSGSMASLKHADPNLNGNHFLYKVMGVFQDAYIYSFQNY